MTLFREMTFRKIRAAAICLAALLPAACKEESETASNNACSCIQPAASLRSVARAGEVWSLTGSLKLTPPPTDRISGRVMLLIDEQHVFSDQRHRIVEREITVNYEQAALPGAPGECGTTSDYDNSDTGYEYASNYESCNCGSGFALDAASDNIDNSYQSGQTGLNAVARGSADSINLIHLEIEFILPDERSVYFAGIHIDVDRDGTVSDGDYLTKEFAPIEPARAQNIQLTAERIESEKTMAAGHLDLQDLAPPPAGATMQVILYDISVPQIPKKIASVTKQDVTDRSFTLTAVPETEHAIWQLTAWIDNNLDGQLDACDYVEAQKTVRYALIRMQNLIVPMAYAGGTASTCVPVTAEEDLTDSADTGDPGAGT